MSWSIGETAALVTKAVRGAGYHWGVAEEASDAVSWLQRRHLPGVAAIALHLQYIATANSRHGECNKHRNCTLLTGIAVQDGSHVLTQQFDCLSQPLLLVPFISRAVDCTRQQLQWGEARVDIGNQLAVVRCDMGALLINASPCRLQQCEELVGGVADASRVAESMQPYIDILEHFAHATYAPATEQSRLAGAGTGGLTDND